MSEWALTHLSTPGLPDGWSSLTLFAALKQHLRGRVAECSCRAAPAAMQDSCPRSSRPHSVCTTCSYSYFLTTLWLAASERWAAGTVRCCPRPPRGATSVWCDRSWPLAELAVTTSRRSGEARGSPPALTTFNRHPPADSRFSEKVPIGTKLQSIKTSLMHV